MGRLMLLGIYEDGIYEDGRGQQFRDITGIYEVYFSFLWVSQLF